MSSDTEIDVGKADEADERGLDRDPDRFYQVSAGSDVKDAFQSSIERFRWATDTAFSTTILDKEDRGYVVIPDDEIAKSDAKGNYARTLLDAGDERLTTGERPAGAINIAGTEQAQSYRERNEIDKGESIWFFFGVSNHVDLDNKGQPIASVSDRQR